MDTITKLLNELQKRINNSGYIILSQENKTIKTQYFFYPVEASIEDGLYIEDKNGCFFWVKNLDSYNLVEDDCGDCIEFALRDKINENYFGICF